MSYRRTAEHECEGKPRRLRNRGGRNGEKEIMQEIMQAVQRLGGQTTASHADAE
jgi:hypothetical protein